MDIKSIWIASKKGTWKPYTFNYKGERVSAIYKTINYGNIKRKLSYEASVIKKEYEFEFEGSLLTNINTKRLTQVVYLNVW